MCSCKPMVQLPSLGVCFPCATHATPAPSQCWGWVCGILARQKGKNQSRTEFQCSWKKVCCFFFDDLGNRNYEIYLKRTFFNPWVASSVKCNLNPLRQSIFVTSSRVGDTFRCVFPSALPIHSPVVVISWRCNLCSMIVQTSIWDSWLLVLTRVC